MLAVYEQARKYCLANYDDEKRVFMDVTKLPAAVVDIQLKERTDLTNNRIGAAQRESILQAGLALQQAGVIAGECRREESARRSRRRPLCHGGLKSIAGVRGRIAFADAAMLFSSYDHRGGKQSPRGNRRARAGCGPVHAAGAWASFCRSRWPSSGNSSFAWAGQAGVWRRRPRCIFATFVDLARTGDLQRNTL